MPIGRLPVGIGVGRQKRFTSLWILLGRLFVGRGQRQDAERFPRMIGLGLARFVEHGAALNRKA
jgi:hypothetical protein